MVELNAYLVEYMANTRLNQSKYKVEPKQIQGLKYSGCGAALPIELVMVVSCFGGLAITLPPPISSPTLFSEVSGHGRLTNTDANTDKIQVQIQKQIPPIPFLKVCGYSRTRTDLFQKEGQ